MTKHQKKLWSGLLIMALLTPLGIIIPEIFNAGGAWGEWGPGVLEKLLGFVPEGLKKYADLWKAPVPDYNLGGEDASTAVKVLSYVASGILGIIVTVVVIYAISKAVMRNEK